MKDLSEIFQDRRIFVFSEFISHFIYLADEFFLNIIDKTLLSISTNISNEKDGRQNDIIIITI